jgi:SAM-dependent methyltransferase
MSTPPQSQFDASMFSRQDTTPDDLFYRSPRKVVHIDDGALRAVTQLYRDVLPAGGAVLDLMSSWRSHLPAGVRFSRVAGLGMNAEEMRDNGQLTDAVVHNLNQTPRLPYDDASFDAAVCCVSVQYLQRPIEVFMEVRRVLKAGAPFVLTFSNRCFPSKAVRLWLGTDDREHMEIVSSYFEVSGGWRDITTADRSPARARLGMGDPLYAVWAYVMEA